MPTIAELGDVMLRGLAAFLRFLGDFFIYLKYTGNNESVVNTSRGNYQSFWDIWYHIDAAILWARKMLFDPYGFMWQINNNATLDTAFGNAMAVQYGNITKMLGDVAGNYSIAFLLRAMTERVSNNPDFAYNLWYAIKHGVILVADALKVFPTYFPP